MLTIETLIAFFLGLFLGWNLLPQPRIFKKFWLALFGKSRDNSED